jgi:dienelactone hydrolase
MNKLKLFLSTAVLSLSAMAADEMPLRTDLNEQVLMIPVGKTFYGGEISLETTFFKPDGDGPFPLVVINEGKTFGNPSFQPRARYPLIASEFLKRGYAVALPMQRGFSKSGGSSMYLDGGCRRLYESTLKQTEDIKALIQVLGQRADINANQIIVSGQSFGGISTLGLAAEPPHGVKLLINFAGGVKQEGCEWEDALKHTAGKLGENAKLASIWFYGENDSLFPLDLTQQMLANFNKTKQTAEFINFGKYRDDAHGMFGSKDGFDTIWWPVVEKKLTELKMPTAVVSSKYEAKTVVASGYAEMTELDKFPTHAKAKCKELYADVITNKPSPRAVAIADNGSCGFSWGEPDAKNAQQVAVHYCKQKAKDSECKLYLLDDKVVWPKS